MNNIITVLIQNILGFMSNKHYSCRNIYYSQEFGKFNPGYSPNFM